MPDGGGGGSAFVMISGEFLVPVHTSVKLTATTMLASDSGYDWSSSDDAIATVAADGTVKGVTSGTAIITAKGKTTMKSGTYPIVVSADVPYLAEWRSSGHADAKAEAFVHWNAEASKTIPTTCAKCHSTPGFRDFVGADGSKADSVETAAALGTTVECGACHNAVASDLEHVVFPSGVKIEGLGPEARCMTCHQGRESSDSVEKTITDAAAADADTVSDKLGFKNIHYFAAGATIEAGAVRSGYQYAGQIYDRRFRHVPGYDTCVGCHDPHSLEVKVADCKKCHAGVTDVASLRNIRSIVSSSTDYDGDGNLSEGIASEIDGLREKLLSGMQAYVTAKSIDKICYSGAAYPYFFKDTDGNGTCSTAEAVAANGYKSWTVRLLRAAYNYQVSLKDPGAFAHNAKYIIQLITDSIADVNLAIDPDIDMSKAVRNDPGHFDGAGQPARHWDTEGEVPGGCSKCHSGSEGFRFYLKFGSNLPVEEPDNGMDCATCHDGFGTAAADFTVVSVPQVTFPSGITVKPDAKTSAKSFVCMTCHQGLESKATIDAALAKNQLAFRNLHYLSAGSTLYGTEAKVGYEYDGKTYAKRWTHTGGSDCTSCHSGKNTKHTFAVEDNLTACKVCHSAATTVEAIRFPTLHAADYDGDGSTTEPLANEISGLRDALLARMQATVAICYSPTAYPYWFKDTNGDKTCQPGEAIFPNSFAPWTAPLVKAAHNFQMSVKEPGAWAHNFDYMAQLLIDSIQDIGGDVSHFTRPPVAP